MKYFSLNDLQSLLEQSKQSLSEADEYIRCAVDLRNYSAIITEDNYLLIDENICVNGKVLFITTDTLSSYSLIILPDFFNSIPVSYSPEGIYLFSKGAPLQREEALLYAGKRLTVLRRKYLCHRIPDGPLGLGALEGLLVLSLKGIIEDSKRVAVSFSGGADSLATAALLLKHFPDIYIYLINTSISRESTFLSRDRESSILAYKWLSEAYGGQVEYVKNNVRREEVIKHHKRILSVSCYRIMDFNLAALHYFTSFSASSLGLPLLLTGAGGDELFLGYSRHRKTANKADAQEMLLEEVKEFDRNNLHRDCLSGVLNGVLLASPFLSHEVFSYCISAADASSVGKKDLFDLLASLLPGFAPPKKLAGQFGSGISDAIRSIQCRCPSLCKENECLSIECSQRETLQ